MLYEYSPKIIKKCHIIGFYSYRYEFSKRRFDFSKINLLNIIMITLICLIKISKFQDFEKKIERKYRTLL